MTLSQHDQLGGSVGGARAHRSSSTIQEELLTLNKAVWL